ncbi:MAG: methionyl-tRNA formyltransferase [Flavobacteriales bacterium]|nr:methionyl-tRNA formyltransferase [Flavobacteriales bacterium]
MGTPEFAVATLETIYSSKHEVVGVVTAPDRPAGRGRKLRSSAVKEYAVNKGIPLAQPEKLRDESFVDQLREWAPEAIVVVAFRMLPKIVWSLPSKGTFNVHASLLPQYRGAAPINWALINGEEKIGVTTFLLDEEIDTGNILLQSEEPISEDDLLEDLYDRLMERGAKLALETLDGLEKGTLEPKPQKASAELRPAPKLNTETGHLDWSASSREIHNLVRGLSPIPGAWTEMINGEERVKVKVYRTHPAVGSKPIGEAYVEGKSLYVGCGEGLLEVLELQPAGKKRMAARDFINGLGGEKSLKFA